jgi:hypothetical protein
MDLTLGILLLESEPANVGTGVCLPCGYRCVPVLA